MRRKIAILITILLLILAVVDFFALKALGIWGAIDSPLKAMLLGVMLVFNIFALPIGVMVALVKMPTRRNKGLCPRCAYDLRYQYSEGCPECGWGRDPIAQEQNT